MGFSFQSAFRNNTITCNEAREVDLDALNMLASGKHDVLCTCAYHSEKGHHHFVYDTLGMTPLPQMMPKMEFQQMLGLLEAMLSLVNLVESGEIALDNLKITKEYIFQGENGFRFIYIPINARKNVRVKDVILRLLSVIRQKDPRIQQLARDMRKVVDDAHAAACLREFVNSFGVGMMYAEAETTALSGQGGNCNDSEGETTALSQAGDAVPAESFVPNNYTPDSEGETTALSQAGDAVPAESFVPNNYTPDSEGETTVLSQARDEAPAESFVPNNYTSDSEGETTVLSQVRDEAPAEFFVPHNYTPDSEGETTALSQVRGQSYTQDSDSERLTVFYADESAEMETMILTSEPELPWVERPETIDGKYRLLLLNNQNGELVPVEVTPFTIGKDRANMDYTVDDDSVSRYHATVVHEDGTYYIIDNHSTNGTRVEGIRLQPEEKAELEHGYMIALGRMTFQAVLERR